MRSERLTRKPRLKRHHRPVDDVTIYDLTRTDYSDTILHPVPAWLSAKRRIAEQLESMPRFFAAPEDVLNWCAGMACESPVANRLWAAAEVEGWSLALGDLRGAGFFLDMDGRQVILDHFCLSPATHWAAPPISAMPCSARW